MTYDEVDPATTIDQLLKEAGVPDPAPPEQLNGVDQFHMGGPAAVERLLPFLDLGPGSRLLDVGSGFGGPARQIAHRTGADVCGVDITSGYVEAARRLTTRCGLDDMVSFELVDVADHVPARPYDAATTMHVQMNVADKDAWYQAISRHLRPGAKLAIWEICRTSDRPMTFPAPWSIDGTDSHLATPDELLAAVTSAGLEPVSWVDDTAWAKEWAAGAARAAQPGPPVGRLLDDGQTRVQNLGAAVADGRLAFIRGEFAKSAS